MAKEDGKLDVMFLPYFTTSHLIPMVDTARLIAADHGVAATIVTTVNNARLFQDSVDRDTSSGSKITVHATKLPAAQVGLPEGIENFGQCSTGEMIAKLAEAIDLLREPVERYVRNNRPDCIVSDMFFPWTADLAEEIKVPRILFYPNNAFCHCVSLSLRLYSPHEKVNSDTETFLIPNLPHEIEMTRSELESHEKTKTSFGDLINKIKDSELKSYGIIFTSYQDLEPAYVDHFKKVRGIKSWQLGLPSHFINRVKLKNEQNCTTEQHSVLNWLETQKPNSVLYVCFGSMVLFPDAQLGEIASALEDLGCPFVWVVKKAGKTEENWLPRGFEENNRGMIVRGWAPQVQILNHSSIGGFLTHCGWNSVLESITAGVPLITWPLFAEQFYNEKLITQVLKIGVGVGSGVWNDGLEIKSPVVGSDKIVPAVNCLMGGSDEAEEIRRRMKVVSEMTKRSVEEGGSTYLDMKLLIKDIKTLVSHRTFDL